MPLYEFKNNETGELEDHRVLWENYDQFLIDNPHLERVYMGNAPGFIGSSVDVHTKAGGGWKDLMSRVKDGAGKESTIKTK